MKLLIAGSRHVTTAMLTLTRNLVQEAIDAGHEIHVGDNPHGIDACVQNTIGRLNAADALHVYYITLTPRYAIAGANLVFVENTMRMNGAAMFRWRDARMIESVDRAAFIWNGSSPGTKAGYDYAKRVVPNGCFMMYSEHGSMTEWIDS